MSEASPTYTVLARRYRPLTFDEVVGQEHVGRTLRNAIAEGRVGHAYLFSGPRGVGKTSTARLLAKALNCMKGVSADPCNACDVCLAVQDGSDTDVIEMDAASNRGVEDARALREGVRYAPLRARHKIYIVDEAHMLTKESFNTLLKTLEEPPPHVKFILATTEAHKIPDTIGSRCQRFEFRRITTADIARRLRQVVDREKLKIDDAVLHACARAARGSMRDGESVLDQLLSFKENGLTSEDVSAILGAAPEARIESLVAALQAGDPGATLVALDAVFASGIDPAAFTDQFVEHVRTLMAIRACGKSSPVVDLPDHMLAAADAQARGVTVEALLYFLQLLFEARRRLREGANPRIVLEVTFVKMSKAADLVSVAEAIKSLQSGAPPAPAPEPRRVERPLLIERTEAPPAPAPAPAAAAQAPAPAAAASKIDSLDALIQAWPGVVGEIKRDSLVAGALLGNARPSRLDAAGVELVLPRAFSAGLETLKLAKNLSVVEAALQRALGRRAAVNFRLDSDAPAGEAGGAVPDLAAHPNVRRVLEANPGSRVVGYRKEQE